jgi:HEAT repeat protein
MGLLKGGSSLECVEKDGTRFCGFGLEQGAAAEALARIGAPALEPLLAALAKGDEEEVSGAIQALARMNDPRAATALIQRVKDPRYPHRKLIPPELGHSEAPRARDLLVSLARDDDPAVRSGALRGIAASKDPRAGGLLIAGLSDAEAAVREAAAFSLARSPAPEAFDALGKALADPSATVRNGACQALGALKDARATESLVAVVAGDPDKLVRFQAGRALEAVTGQQFGEDGAAWQRWYEKTKQPK